MDASKSLIRYIQTHRPTEDPLEFDRTIRLILAWLQTHKIREMQVFKEQEGKEYNALINHLEEILGHQVVIETELFNILLSL